MERQDPPVSTRGTKGNHYIEEAEEARANPGVWFVLKSWPDATDKDKAAAYGQATTIRAGKVAAFRPAGVFEARGAVHEDGSVKLHIRFVDFTAAKTPKGKVKAA